MSLALAVGDEVWPVGSPDVLHAMFSTIAVLLEDGQWASRFPMLLDRLYQGELAAADVEDAVSELRTVRRELTAFGPGEVVWDVDDRSEPPPWDPLPPDVPNVAHCFRTADGRPLLEVLASALGRLRIDGDGALRIVTAVSADV